MTNKSKIIWDLVKEHGHRIFNPQETITQLRHFGGAGGVMSWGFRSPMNLDNRGLQFKVNGHHHSGDVLITLDGSDTYTVFIINNRGRVLDTFEGVYFDDLFTIIDNRIERIAEYVR